MLKCLIYLAAIGLVSFLIGRILPKSWFRFDAALFRPFSFEKNGKIYVKLGVKKWKERVPDMSRIVPFIMPSKKLPKTVDCAQLSLMLQETCIAEWIHAALCIAGAGCIFLWKGVGGWIIFILNIIGNLPFIIIQRYNRPKLVRLLNFSSNRERKEIREIR